MIRRHLGKRDGPGAMVPRTREQANLQAARATATASLLHARDAPRPAVTLEDRNNGNGKGHVCTPRSGRKRAE